jgi:hypothetical protein
MRSNIINSISVYLKTGLDSIKKTVEINDVNLP